MPRSKILFLIFAIEILFTYRVYSVPANSSKTSFCKTAFARLGITSTSVVIAAGGLFYAFAGPTMRLDSEAEEKGLKHIGYGIFLDTHGIENLLSPSEKKMLKNPKKDELKVALMFSQKLEGDYDHQVKAPLPFPILNPAEKRNASTFFKGQSKARGVCRHKATILKAVLSSYEIKAEVFRGKTKSGVGHVWVKLSSSKTVVDPTWGVTLPETEYLKHYELKSVEEAKLSYCDRGQF